MWWRPLSPSLAHGRHSASSSAIRPTILKQRRVLESRPLRFAAAVTGLMPRCVERQGSTITRPRSFEAGMPLSIRFGCEASLCWYAKCSLLPVPYGPEGDGASGSSKRDNSIE